METDPIRMCELLVGLPEVRVLGVEQPDDGSQLVVHVACPEDWQRDCGRCGTLHNWTSEILVWHTTRASNGPTEGQTTSAKPPNASVSDSAPSATTASASYSTPAASTGTCSQP